MKYKEIRATVVLTSSLPISTLSLASLPQWFNQRELGTTV